LPLLLDLGRPSPWKGTGTEIVQQEHAIKTVRQRFATLRIAGWIFKKRQSALRENPILEKLQ